MRLLTAHRILIAAAIAMFAFLTFWELRHSYVAAVVSGAVTLGFVAYYRYRFR